MIAYQIADRRNLRHASRFAPPQSPARHWPTDDRIRVHSGVLPVIFLGLGRAEPVVAARPCRSPGAPVGYDFIAFPSGAWLALQRRPEAACDWRGIPAAHNVAVPAPHDRFWHDPPIFPLPVRALCLLPCLAAPATFLAVSLAWHCGRLIRRIVEDRRFRILAAARAAGRINLFHGKNGLRAAALAGFALQLLERRPAGDRVLIGLLAIKPHPAILFPIARAASGR